jgi:hypothetical protein
MGQRVSLIFAGPSGVNARDMMATEEKLWADDADIFLLRFSGTNYGAQRTAIKEWVTQELGSGSVPTANYVELPFLAVRDPHRKLNELAAPSSYNILSPIRLDPARALITLGLDRALSVQFAIENDIEINGFGRLAAGGNPDVQAIYPAIDFTSTPPLITALPDIQIPTRHGRLIAINLSLGTNEIVEPADEDPVSLAIRFASTTVPVVVAAGNNGYISSGDDTMNAWARSSAVISVAATTGAEGGVLAEFSSVGSKHQRHIHPTVAAYGASALNEEKKGTSFAAPRVCRQLVSLGSYWQGLVARNEALRGRLEGIPLPWIFFVDRRIDNNYMHRPSPLLPALPRAGIDIEALQYLLRRYERVSGRWLDVSMTPRRLKRLLMTSARSLPGLSQREIGAGFVNDHTTLDQLCSLTAADFLRILEPRQAQRHPELVEDLEKVNLSIPH